MENYNISHLVGEGSFGKVYKAIEKSTQNIVALKILSKVIKTVVLFVLHATGSNFISHEF